MGVIKSIAKKTLVRIRIPVCAHKLIEQLFPAVPLASPTLEGYRTKWSCCQLLSMEQHPTHKAHAATG